MTPAPHYKMIIRFAAFLLLMAPGALWAQDAPTLEMVVPEVSPLSQRQLAIENYLNIQQHTWKLYMPKGYKGLLTFRQRDEVHGKFEVGEDSTNYLLFMVARSPEDAGKMRVTFAFKNWLRSIDVVPRGGGWSNWTFGYGELKGAGTSNVFQINDAGPGEGPTTWCELEITKK